MSLLGGQTVTLLSYTTTGVRDASGMAQNTEVATPVKWCRHRPVPETAVRELKRQYGDVGVVVGVLSWRTFLPITPETMLINPADRLVVDGLTYVVMGGALPVADMGGKPNHVIVISERQEAGH